MSFESFKKLYNSRGVSLRRMGAGGRGLSREWALRGLDELEDAGVPVSGGQVLTMKDNGAELSYTYDAWDTEMRLDETYSDYCARSLRHAREYISTFREWQDRLVLYEIVLGWGKNLYLMDPDDKT